MRQFFEILLGFSLIGYGILVIVKIYYAATGTDNTTWSDISVHLIIAVCFLVVMGFGYWSELKEKKKEKLNIKKRTPQKASSEKPIDTFNPYTDVIKFDSIYLEEAKTWWNDNDGDYHYHSTERASLRFYEDGTLLGIRLAKIPHGDLPDTFTYKGTWQVEKNKLSFQLKKVTDVDDTIDPYIPYEDQRQMKYAGHIANDDSLIKAGNYEGIIQNGALKIGKHDLNYQSTSDLIITATESTCQELEQYFSNSPLLFSVFQNSGNWYTNGETGAEWFTVHLRTIYRNKELVDAELDQALRTLNLQTNNVYWS